MGGLAWGTSRREFREPIGADAMLSMAVMASMLLEIEPSKRFAATASYMDSVEPARAPNAATTPETPPTAAPVEVPTARPLPAAISPAPRPSTRAVDSASRLRWAVAGGARFESAVAAPAFGGALGIDASLERSPSSLWSPSVRAEFVGTLEVTKTVQSQTSLVGDPRLGVCLD